jgi:outer membrane protein OmpA-like peptidoglycan-associated protein
MAPNPEVIAALSDPATLVAGFLFARPLRRASLELQGTACRFDAAPQADREVLAMNPDVSNRRLAIPLAASTLAAAIIVGAAPGDGQAVDQRMRKFDLAQAQQPPATENEEDKARRKARSKADDERAKAEEEHRKQEAAKAEADRANKATQEERQRQQRDKDERRKQERDKAEAERRANQEEAKAAAARAKQVQEQKRAEDKAQADQKLQDQKLQKERAKLEQDRAKLERDREAAERERAKAALNKQQQRGQQLQQQQERVKAEEARLKAIEDDLKRRDDRARAEADQQRRRGEQVRDREQGVRTAERQLQRLEDIQRQRQRRVEEGGRIVIEEPDSRRIVKDKDRTFIRHDEGERFRRVASPFRTERRGDGIMVHAFRRPDGTEIVSELGTDGQLVRRYRRTPQGRVVVLIDNRRYYRSDRAFFEIRVNLPPPVIRIPRERYIVEYSRASEDEIYEALRAPPVERLGRTYSLEEIRYSDELRARMRRIDLDEVTFEFGSWEVRPDQLPKLERLAHAINRLLRRNSNEIVLIEGYTDAVGTEEDNLTLSDRRAEAVAVMLSQEFGVPPENLVTQGYGEQFLKIDTEEAERANRRVAVRRITPMLSQGGS